MDVSVVVPAYNEGRHLGECLRALRAQRTDLRYEVIVSDGGSEDHTVPVARRLADRVVIERRRGIWIGRNTGARAARGRVLVFVDADTLVPRNFLESVEAVLQDEEIAGVSCAFRFDERTPALRAVEELSNTYLLAQGWRGRGEILGFNNAMRRDVFRRAGGFPDKPMEDRALGRKLWRLGRVVYLPEPKVVTSARRLSRGGLLRSAAYYANLSLLTDLASKELKRLSLYQKYLPVRG
jgi:glycosyltransferase involved in cell wall biosynthesis